MADARLISAALAACAFSFACTSPWGLKLQQHVYLPAPVVIDGVPFQREATLPCCGASTFRDVDLSAAGDIEVDLTNPNGSGVDGFLTNVGCNKLFDAPYTGAPATPLCQVHIGPVRPRVVSERKKLAPGRYRFFAQGFATNDTSMVISIDLGVWSTACRWNPIAQ
jgi:hypothetical protein